MAYFHDVEKQETGEKRTMTPPQILYPTFETAHSSIVSHNAAFKNNSRMAGSTTITATEQKTGRYQATDVSCSASCDSHVNAELPACQRAMSHDSMLEITAPLGCELATEQLTSNTAAFITVATSQSNLSRPNRLHGQDLSAPYQADHFVEGLDDRPYSKDTDEVSHTSTFGSIVSRYLRSNSAEPVLETNTRDVGPVLNVSLPAHPIPTSEYHNCQKQFDGT